MATPQPPLQQFVEQIAIQDQELPVTVPHIQTEYTFLTDDSVQHTIPQLEAHLVDAVPQAIHYDVFGGINVHQFVLDPLQFVYDQAKMGQPFLDAEDAALFPPELLEEMVKDRKNKAIIPPVDDITDAKLRLLNITNEFSHEVNKTTHAETQKNEKLKVVKPYMFETEHRKIAIMQSAEKNALNFYYNVCYTEDTIRTNRDTRKHADAIQRQKSEALHAVDHYQKQIKLQGDKYNSDIKYEVDATNREQVAAYIDDSFEAMNETPIHPTLPDQQAMSITPFFPTPLNRFTGQQLPSHIEPSSIEPQQRAYLDTAGQFVIISATSETHFTPDYLLTHSLTYKTIKTDGDDQQSMVQDTSVRDGELWSLYRPKNASDLTWEPDNDVLDDEADSLLKQPLHLYDQPPVTELDGSEQQQQPSAANNNKDRYCYVWERLVSTQPPQALAYEDALVVRYDEQNLRYSCAQVHEKIRFKPWVRDRKMISKIHDKARVITVNHPTYVAQALDFLRDEAEAFAEDTSGATTSTTTTTLSTSRNNGSGSSSQHKKDYYESDEE